MLKKPSHTSTLPKPLFVETSALTSANMSGIGHTLVSILKTWKQNDNLISKFEPILVVPFDKKKAVQQLELGFRIKVILLPEIAVRALRRFNLLPYMDIFIGRGDYLFPNYWNWPLLNSRSFTYAYDVSFLVYPEFTDSKNQKFLSKYLKTWLNRANGVITISNHAKEEIVKYTGINSQKIEVIYNGIDTTPNSLVTKEQIQSTKIKYSIKGNYLLFVGNIEPRKNIERLIAAYRLLPPNLQATHSLVLVGAYGWKNDQIKQAIESAVSDGLNVLKINVFVPDGDVRKLYAGAKILVHPALYEGFGMTPLEAMAVGTPTIVGDNSSLPEVMGNASLYVDAMNERDISVKIEELLENDSLREKLIRAGEARVSQFTWTNTTEKIAAFIKGHSNG